jgi:hypothetical protein
MFHCKRKRLQRSLKLKTLAHKKINVSLNNKNSVVISCLNTRILLETLERESQRDYPVAHGSEGEQIRVESDRANQLRFFANFLQKG